MEKNSLLKSVFCFILGWKQHFKKFSLFFILHEISWWKTTLLKTVFCTIVVSKPHFAKFSPIFAKRWFFHQIHLWNRTLPCFFSLLKKWVFPNFHHFSLKKGLCIKSTHWNTTIFFFIVAWKQRFAKLFPFLADKCVLHEIQSWNT